MTAKVILFDFDGTIADTYQVIANITNQLSKEFGYKALNPDELLLLKSLSSREIVKRSEISIFKIPFLLRRVRAELSKEIAELPPITDIAKILLKLKKKGYILGIVTSNSKDNVEKFLSENQLIREFSYIYCSNTIFGKHRIINQVIKDNQLDKSQMIYVGDETRDIRSARKSSIGVISVGWGFNSAKILQEYQPDHLVEHPQELLNAIANYYSSQAKTS